MMDIVELKENNFEEIYTLSVQLSDRFKIHKDVLKDSLKVIINDKNAILIGIIEGDKLIGYLSGYKHTAIYANGKVSWIDEIVIDKSYRKCGYGRALITEFENIVSQHSVKLVSLSTRGVPQFYEKLGYEGGSTYFKKYL
ncbi:MAG: GNAT family N-acetyltransferase [Clostridiaceae bacterium]